MSGNKESDFLSQYEHDHVAQEKCDSRYQRTKILLWIGSVAGFSLLIYLVINRHDSLHVIAMLAALILFVLVATLLGTKYCENIWDDCENCARTKKLFDMANGERKMIPSDGEHQGYEVQRIAMICECKHRFVWLKYTGQKFETKSK